jgi:uncharacterized membrane protein YbhN (UPF0104 family)
MFWIGMMFSQVLPSSSGGDALRIVLAWRHGVAFVRAAHSVILERVIMLVTLLVLVAGLQLFGGKRLPTPEAALLAPLFLGGATAGMLLLLYADRLVAQLASWKLFRALSELSADARRLLSSRAAAKLTALCLLTHLNLAVVTFFLGRALAIHLNLLDYIFFTSIITLIISLPLSIGGWGIREGSAVALLGSAGVPAHSALAFSILYGLSVAAISVCALPFASIKMTKSTILAGVDAPNEDAQKLTCLTTGP